MVANCGSYIFCTSENKICVSPGGNDVVHRVRADIHFFYFASRKICCRQTHAGPGKLDRIPFLLPIGSLEIILFCQLCLCGTFGNTPQRPKQQLSFPPVRQFALRSRCVCYVVAKFKNTNQLLSQPHLQSAQKQLKKRFEKKRKQTKLRRFFQITLIF